MAYTSPYGDYLPIFPTLYSSPSNPITEDRIERTVERLMDYADQAFLAGKATETEYRLWIDACDRWAREQYAL